VLILGKRNHNNIYNYLFIDRYMRIKEISAGKILDSRRIETIAVFVRTDQGTFSTSSPSGTSTGKHERPTFVLSIGHDISVLKDTKFDFEIDKFGDLVKVEDIIRGKIGANSLYALEASILKALASEKNVPLWKLLNPGATRLPFPVSNIIGGGMHTDLTDGKKADFQEFLIIPRKEKIADNVFLIKKAHELAGKILVARGVKGGLNYEGAWATSLENEGCLSVLNQVREELEQESGAQINIGIDCASSSFFRTSYYYRNPPRTLKPKEQISYISEIAERFMLSYVEDPLQEEDYAGFSILREDILKKRPCLIVGDDLTTSNLGRFKDAVKKKSIGGIILKPNQIGSLVEINNIVGLCKKLGIAMIMSHRSGETLDYTIADLAFAWQVHFLKCSVIGAERDIKWRRLIEIEKSLDK
jgi:enolase